MRLKNAVVFLIVELDNIILKHLKMMYDEIVDIAEKRYFVSPDDLHDFLYPVVKFFTDINRFSQSCRNIGFLDKQGFVIQFAAFPSSFLFWRFR